MKTPAVASAAGVKAAAMGANGIESSSLADGAPVQHDANYVAAPLEAAAQKALPAALIVMFKKHSVVNMHDVRYGASYSQLVCLPAATAQSCGCSL